MNIVQLEQARALLQPHLPKTRLVPAPSLARATKSEIYLKLENEMPTGSFKPRGALHALLKRQERGHLAGVVTSSTGNHGAAVAYAAHLLGFPATIFLPENPNPVKRARIAELGATIVEKGSDLAETIKHAIRYAQEQGLYFMHDGRDPDMTPGPATIACEILEQLPETDVIYVPVGDTTLIRGVALAAKLLKPGIRIVGVQAQRAPAYYLSWKQRRVITTGACDTIADGLATRLTVGENVQEICELVDEMHLVTDEQMLLAIGRLLLDEHVVAEPAGAASTAAFFQSSRAHTGQTVVLLITGCNLTPAILRKVKESIDCE